ncbi:MAG TPA: NAD-binding protein [Ktedonobacterales bacterium]|nr:NAD-binding protein [Ktedonobacterales bacterium]
MAPTTATSRRALRGQEQRRYSTWRLIRANLYDFGLLARQSSLVLIGFVLMVVIGTLYFRFFYTREQLATPMALFQAFKLLFFASDEKLPFDLPGQILFFVVPLLGLALLTQGVLNFGRLVLDKRDRREAWQVALASTYRRHVIVCGLGHVGLRVVTHLLEAGYEAIVIERDWSSEYVARALNLKVPVVLGDARELTTLRQAGLKRARAIVASVNNDLVNIDIALVARAAHPGIQTILRIFSEELDRNLEQSFGPNTAFSSSALAAPTLAAASVSHQIDYVLTLDSSPDLLGVSHLTLPPNNPFAGPLWKFEESESVRVLAHQNAAGRPSQNLALQELKAGDRLTLLGALPLLETLHLKLADTAETVPLAAGRLRHSNELLDRVIVCGLGKVGYRVVQRLYYLTPRPQITVIHLDDDQSFSRQISDLQGIKTVIGDARDIETLQKADVQHATTIAAVTSDDLVNLQIGLAARHAHPHLHLVLRVFSDTLAVKLGDLFHISTTYSTSELAGSTLAAASILSGVGQALFVGEDLLATDLHTIRANDRLTGNAIQTIRTQEQVLVIALRRQGHTLTLPPLDTVITPGDEVTILATLDTLARLRGV